MSIEPTESPFRRLLREKFLRLSLRSSQRGCPPAALTHTGVAAMAIAAAGCWEGSEEEQWQESDKVAEGGKDR